MGIKELWAVLSPYCDRKPLVFLQGTKVAIDLAGWICESSNVNSFIHPRHYLKNLFFRTCYLIWEGVTPVFVLEGDAPSLKNDVIMKRCEKQFPKVHSMSKKLEPNDQLDLEIKHSSKGNQRQRFNHVLKQCEKLLRTMGIDCIQAPGEAEAYCAFLNKKKLVDGVISQDSDCFAYGATRVYRNFSTSMQGAQAAKDGAVDIYDLEKIQQSLDFGQRKAIAMALLCGCDYCPGVDGVGRDSILKLFKKYSESEILDRISCWRTDSNMYNALQVRVADRNVCTNCGHVGSTHSHTKNGCFTCQSKRSCNHTLWKEERILIKSELELRKKALSCPNFPNQEIISEFLSEPKIMPEINFTWKQPNIINFVMNIGPLLQWTKFYCFQKFFPVLARWQIRKDAHVGNSSCNTLIIPTKITKKITRKGILSMEILWKAQDNYFNLLIKSDEVLQQALVSNDKLLDKLLRSEEPISLVEAAYPTLLETFLQETQKPECLRGHKKVSKQSKTNSTAERHVINKRKKEMAAKNLQNIDKFFSKQNNQPSKSIVLPCSTPKSKNFSFELESDCEIDINVSAAVKEIVERPTKRNLKIYTGQILHYEKKMSTSK